MESRLTVAKFGGTSVADAASIRKVAEIILKDPARRIIVPSAPGERKKGDAKITNLLLDWYQVTLDGGPSSSIRNTIEERYLGIANDLQVSIDIKAEMAHIAEEIERIAAAENDSGPDFGVCFAASRGEYLMAKILAKVLGYEFIDAADCIRFDSQGKHIKNDPLIERTLRGKKAVVPGYYGRMECGTIVTFPRNGTDISAAIIARALKADLCENWKDVDGFLMADPTIVKNPRKVEELTYGELRELADRGKHVIHPEATLPLLEGRIRCNIRNTNNPNDTGTIVIPEEARKKGEHDIVGIAGKTNFTTIEITKVMMNDDIGYVRRVLSVLEVNKVPFQQLPCGTDTICIVLEDKKLSGSLDKIIHEIKDECAPDSIRSFRGEMSLIAIVGKGMDHTLGVAARLFAALLGAKINTKMISQPPSELTIVVGVDNKDYERAIRAIYDAFVVNKH